MGYMHIDNLYKYKDVLLFKEVYATEKIHGTSAHISWKNNKVSLFAGGEDHLKFSSLFDINKLTEKFNERFLNKEITVYGEAYGGRQQGMSHTYGDKLQFIVFDVLYNDSFCNLRVAEKITEFLELEFVPWKIVPATVEALDAERDADSIVASRRGILEPKKREGIVIRPIVEMNRHDGKRVIAKHKREDFSETKTKRQVSLTDEDLKVLEDAKEIAEEWVTPMRLIHVLQKFPSDATMEYTTKIIEAMYEDVEREAEGEIVKSKLARKAIGKKTVELFKKYLQDRLKEESNEN